VAKARRSGDDESPRREKPVGRMKRYAEARRNNNDLLADIERMLLREHDEPQMQNGALRRQDVIHPSEMAKSDWCPRSTYLRIKAVREGRIVATEAAHFQLENIFEEGHAYHAKWQDRFRRMGRLFGRWYCEACTHRWEAKSPLYCPECGAPEGAITYHEVALRDSEHLIVGNADGLVLALASDADDVLIEVKSIGEGTVRQELPAVLGRHTHEVEDPQWKRMKKVLDHRGVWKDITKPFGPHLRQGLIYLRLWGQANAALGGETHLSDIQRICFIYEYKPTSAVKAFYVKRNDEAVQELWDFCADIVYALDRGGQPPRCIDRSGPCKACQPYEEQSDDAGTAPAGRAAQGQPARRRGAGEEAAPAAAPAAHGSTRVARRPDRPRGQRADGPARADDAVGRLLGRAARPR
jgi:rubrerythrin